MVPPQPVEKPGAGPDLDHLRAGAVEIQVAARGAALAQFGVPAGQLHHRISR